MGEQTWTKGDVVAAPWEDPQWVVTVVGDGPTICLTAHGNDEANARRMATCWQALAGIDDPAAYRERVERLMVALIDDDEPWKSMSPRLRDLAGQLREARDGREITNYSNVADRFDMMASKLDDALADLTTTSKQRK